MFNSIILILGVSVVQVFGTKDWSYKGANGPEHWKDKYPTCGAKSQSPIDIKREDVMYKDLGAISFENYDNQSALAMSINNNGHTAKVYIDRGEAFISGSGLADNKYQLSELHFHWGDNSNRGSEHKQQGKAYACEMHLVHFNSKYSDISEAVGNKPHGLAVLGVFLEVDSTDNAAFTTLIDALDLVKDPSDSLAGVILNIQPIKLETLLPSNTDDFYRYQGSLTTPGCSESVQWTVFENSVKLSEAQLAEFRKLLDLDDNPLVDNYRPVQPLNGRQIYSTNKEAARGDSMRFLPSVASTVLITVIAMFLA